jgi:hypothetical protein
MPEPTSSTGNVPAEDGLQKPKIEADTQPSAWVDLPPAPFTLRKDPEPSATLPPPVIPVSAPLASTPPPPPETRSYYPLIDTLRLYAGWLLAWYFVIYALGSYQFLRGIPLHIPFLESLFGSPVVLTFAAGAFLFLLLSGIHRAWGRGILKGLFLLIIGVAVFTVFQMNV